jgi:hypothetical protein
MASNPPHSSRNPAECPACGEERLVEFDSLALRWHCNVCSETWRNRPGRHLPSRPAQGSLPGTVPPLDFDVSELPPSADSRPRWKK